MNHEALEGHGLSMEKLAFGMGKVMAYGSGSGCISIDSHLLCIA